jgi:hypothetical protein
MLETVSQMIPLAAVISSRIFTRYSGILAWRASRLEAMRFRPNFPPFPCGKRGDDQPGQSSVPRCSSSSMAVMISGVFRVGGWRG